MTEYKCPVCDEKWTSKDEFVSHLEDEYQEHQTLANEAADLSDELGAAS